MSQSTLPSSLKTYSVLPDNRSALERALELSLSQQLYSVPHYYPQLLDARHTPIDVVPHIAAERQLPVWDITDPENVKRKLVGNAWQVRRLSGTRTGLKMALESFDFQSEITPWHKQTPQGEPYSLEVVAWEKNNKPMDVANVQKLMKYIDETQSLRDQADLFLSYGVEFKFGIVGAAPVPVAIRNTEVEAELWPLPDARFGFGISGGITRGINVCSLSCRAIV